MSWQFNHLIIICEQINSKHMYMTLTLTLVGTPVCMKKHQLPSNYLELQYGVRTYLGAWKWSTEVGS